MQESKNFSRRKLTKTFRRNMGVIRREFSERLFFFKRFINRPTKVGSITPSSKYLFAEMIKGVDFEKISSIAELGAGTGVFTKHLKRLMSPKCNLLVFELDSELAEMIEKKFPHIKVYKDATNLQNVAQDKGITDIECILSSIPFANLPEPIVYDIMQNVVNVLSADGKFITYQYSHQMKDFLNKIFANVEIDFVLRNIPPAFVYKCSSPNKNFFKE